MNSSKDNLDDKLQITEKDIPDPRLSQLLGYKGLHKAIVDYIKSGKINENLDSELMRNLVSYVEDKSGVTEEFTSKHKKKQLSYKLAIRKNAKKLFIEALDEYRKTQKRKLHKKKQKKEAHQTALDQAEDILSNEVAHHSSAQKLEISNIEHLEMPDEQKDINYDILDSSELDIVLNEWSTEELHNLWNHRIEKINTISDACKLLSELRYRQGVDKYKQDPNYFYRTSQIQELLEHLSDDYYESKQIPEVQPQKKIGQVTQTIREGQATFRKGLIDYYGCKCMITGEAIQEVIEAAHIHGYDGLHTNEIGNGMLLRADIHKLFDKGFIAIHPLDHTVYISKKLKESSYFKLNNQDLKLSRLPVFKHNIFQKRWEEFKHLYQY